MPSCGREATLRCVTSGPPPDPGGRPRRARGDNGGGFFVHRPDDPAAVAALRDELGEEAFAHWQRRREMLHSARPLTRMESAVLRQAAAPLLADLAASSLGLPDIRDEAHEEREAAVCGWIQGPGRTGEGIWVLLDSSPAEQIAQLAEQLQNWAADQLDDAGRPPEWPECPQHPSPPRRLDPQVREGRAAWVCPETGQIIWPVGELVMPGAGRLDRGERLSRQRLPAGVLPGMPGGHRPVGHRTAGADRPGPALDPEVVGPVDPGPQVFGRGDAG